MEKDKNIIKSSATKIPWQRRLAANAAAAVVFCSLIAAISLYIIHYGYHSKSPLAGIGSNVFKQAHQPTRQEMLNAIVSKIPLATVSTPNGLQHLIAGIPPSLGVNPVKLTVPLAQPSTIGLRLPVKPTFAESSDERWEAALHPSQLDTTHLATIQLAGQGPDPIDEAERLERARQFVMSMCVDLQGNIWVGTEDGGVQRFNPLAPKFHEWTQFTTKDGLGDDNGYAIACDHEGRIWVGHLNHGVSVFNGQHWQNYDVVEGQFASKSLAGPLGSRIFGITVCPVDGDVWMATEEGIARYSDVQDTWSYYSQAEGLPNNQVNSIAFDEEGNIYAATQCNGIAIAKRVNNYREWSTVQGAVELPLMPSGQGLPTDEINQVLVAHDGTIWAATTTGLAWSVDRGLSWQYSRGRDWIAKVWGRAEGAPSNWKHGTGADWPEDYITCICEDESHVLWIGTRRHGFVGCVCSLSGKHTQVVSGADNGYITCILAPPNQPVLIERYEVGLLVTDSTVTHEQSKAWTPAALPWWTHSNPPLPKGAPAPNLHDLNDILETLANVRPVPAQANPPLMPIDDDWRTQGSWLGRYGRYWACLCAMGTDELSGNDWIDDHSGGLVSYVAYTGSHARPGEGLRYWMHWQNTSTIRSLEVPSRFGGNGLIPPLKPMTAPRRQSEWDDHGETYQASFDGPDICSSVKIPRGCYLLSFYDVNKDGHTGMNPVRDYRISVKVRSSDDQAGYLATAPAVTSRLLNFWGGAYKRFVVLGPIELNIRVKRDNSYNTILAGIFLDRIQVPNHTNLPYLWQYQVQWNKLFEAQTNSAIAANTIVNTLNEMKMFNASWYSSHSPAIWVKLLRWYGTMNRSHKLAPKLLTDTITCAQNSGLWELAEQYQDALDVESPRHLELASFSHKMGDTFPIRINPSGIDSESEVPVPP